MVKVKGPLFSAGASGTLGRAISYRRQLFGDQVEKKPKKRDLKSAAQLTRRGLFQGAVAYWNGLSEEEKEAYKSLAAGLPMTGFNLCVRDYLLGVIEVGFDVEEEGEVKVAGASKLNFLSAFAVADEGGGRAGISLDVEESPLLGLAKLAGRAGGQVLFGGTGEGEHLTLQSTAHASRGYVRAQDDLQLLSNIIRDAAATARLTLAAASPHATLAGDTALSGHASVGPGNLPVTTRLLDVEGTVNTHPASAIYAQVYGTRAAGPQFTYGLSGGARGQGTPSASYVYGLYFFTQHDTPSICYQLGGILIQQQSGASGTGALYNARGIYISAAYWGGSKPVTVCGVDIEDQGNAAVTTAYGLRILDQTATTVRLLELGPATPYLRLLGGAAPGANQTNLYLNEGGTLRRVEWKLQSALVAGDRVMVLV